jgi:hypothetical protein
MSKTMPDSIFCSPLKKEVLFFPFDQAPNADSVRLGEEESGCGTKGVAKGDDVENMNGKKYEMAVTQVQREVLEMIALLNMQVVVAFAAEGGSDPI